jgi:hypothetical protein
MKSHQLYRPVTADQRHQLAVRRDHHRPVRDGRRQGPARRRAHPAAGDRDRRGHRRGRGRRRAGLLGVPAGLPSGRTGQAATGMPARFPRAVHRLLARQARLLPPLPPRHLNSEAVVHAWRAG